MEKERISLVLNILIVIFVPLAWLIMYFGLADSGSLAAVGLYSLRYYTVLSNLLAMLTSLVYVVQTIRKKDTALAFMWKYIASCMTALTFLVVVVFLGPTAEHGYFSMFAGANFFFHLIVPILAMADVALFCRKDIKIPFFISALSMITVLIYGSLYLGNVLINGVTDELGTNDWYGFVTWGIPVALVIFAVIILVIWLLALCIRRLHNR